MRTAHLLRRTFCSLAVLAATANAQVVISQVYGAGGNSGATLTNDYVELFNRGNSSVSLTDMSLQYASATGTGNFGATATQLVTLSGSIAAGQYYLVKLAGGAVGSALPTEDASGTIAMAAGAGKVALVTGTTSLGCNGGSTPCDSAALARVVDLVGYGSANYFEGAAAAPTISATTAAFRAASGCTDTNVNSADFSTGTPVPRNSSTALHVCGVNGPVSISTATVLTDATQGIAYSQQLVAAGGSGSFTWSVVSGLPASGIDLSASGLVSGTPTAPTTVNFTARASDSGDSSNFAEKAFSLTINSNVPTCTVTQNIWQIQGSTATSAYAGQSVVTRGIVTARKSNGFFLQAPAPGDGDSATSDGVFVFTSSAPPVAAAVGNDVCVAATVQEFSPSTDPNSPPVTELSSSPVVTLMSAGNALPPAVTITSADTLVNTLDNLEKYEGMRVQIPSLTAVAPTQGSVSEANATSTSNGVFYGVVTGVDRPFREAGVQLPDPLPSGASCCVPRFDANPERIRVDSDGQSGGSVLDVTTGATITGLVGVLDYAFRTYTILPDPGSNPGVSGNISATPVADPAANETTVGGLNVERFFDTVNDPSVSDVALTATAFNNRLNKLSLLIRNVMKAPDIVGVVEMENLSTLQAVAEKLNADTVAASLPNPNYQAYLVEGNDIGGIDVGFLVKSSKVNVVDVTQFGKDTTYVDPGTNQPALLNDRPPLVLRATVTKAGSSTALPITVIANHLRSLNGVDDPADGARVRAKRAAQAEYLANLVQARLTTNPNENILLLGDFNAFSVNDGYVDLMGTIKGTPTPASQVVLASSDLVNPDLSELEDTLPAAGRYSYSFDGNAQSLDHMLVTSTLLPRVNRFAIAHVDADFPEVYRNDPNRPERLSDHDGEVAYISLPDTLDVTADCHVVTSGFVHSRLTNLDSAAITVKNKSGATIHGPVYVFFDGLPSGVTLANATGYLDGTPYLLVSATDLPNNDKASAAMRISNTGSSRISFTTRVVAGSL
ncbi:lamin tail domain-containing protein [uncultured Paludibaculum sp.]|uniref:endonuclease/exonuclease/phosphatase family protein n=1 Tax=uncultured Paludibaculum sp. TaxID=1765020 RepID=UPI002AABE94F|nr:lamin tail domain-containing protein [uncultured Paludibaculum sp.]